MRKYLKALISILIIPCVFCSCSGVHYNSGEEKIGFSVTQTLMTENEDKLTTSIVFVENGMAETVFNFNMTSQYPLGIFDKINNSVFFIQNDDKGNDQFYLYTIDNKEVSQLTDSLYAVNNIFPTQNGAFLCAVDDYYVSPFYYDSNSDRIIKCINDDKFNAYAAAYCHEKNMLLVSGFDGDEDYAKTEKYNESETPVPYSVKNTVYLVSADSKKKVAHG